MNTPTPTPAARRGNDDPLTVLRAATPAIWTEKVLTDFDTFLPDHAAAEKKAAGMAISMLSHYPDRIELVTAMSELAVEEMSHFRDVVALLHDRGLTLQSDQPDPYVNALRKQMRNGRDEYFLDRLLIGGIIEARGAERFGLIGEAIDAPKLQRFYRALARSEARHMSQFTELAGHYFPAPMIDARLQELLPIEAEIMTAQPIRAALH